MRMNRFGKFPVSRNGTVIGCHQHVRCVAGRFVNAGNLNNDKPGTTLSSRLVIGNQSVCHVPIMSHHSIVPRRNNPILDNHRANADRFEEIDKLCHLNRIFEMNHWFCNRRKPFRRFLL